MQNRTHRCATRGHHTSYWEIGSDTLVKYNVCREGSVEVHRGDCLIESVQSFRQPPCALPRQARGGKAASTVLASSTLMFSSTCSERPEIEYVLYLKGGSYCVGEGHTLRKSGSGGNAAIGKSCSSYATASLCMKPSSARKSAACVAQRNIMPPAGTCVIPARRSTRIA